MASISATLPGKVGLRSCAARPAGLHLGILNAPLRAVAADMQFDRSTTGGVVVSALNVGAIVGSLFAGRAADKRGPRTALMYNNFWFAVGSLLCATTPLGVWGLLAGKWLPAGPTSSGDCTDTGAQKALCTQECARAMQSSTYEGRRAGQEQKL